MESLQKFLPNLHRIGTPSYDYHTFILKRRSRDLNIRKYPHHVGISVFYLEELLKRGCQLIIIEVDGVALYKTTPTDWLFNGVQDKLSPLQDLHSFIPIARLRRFS